MKKNFRKKRILSLLLATVMCLGVGGLAACGQAGGTDDGGGDNPPDHVAEAEFSRADAAKIVADKAGFTGGENLTEDVKDGDKNSEDIYACVSRNIFGEPTLEYNFRPNEAVTRYDTAKISVYTYAALLGVEDENLEPGVQDGITDIGELSVEQRWFVHCANANGFIEDTDGKFEPGKEVTEQEFSSAIDKAVQKAAVEGTNYEAYKAKKLENFRTFPNAGAPLADKLDKFVVSGMGDAGQRLAVATLQGIVNRDEIKLYLDYGGYSWMSDYAIEKEYFDGYETPVPDNDYLALLTRYADYIDGAIVFDPDLPWSINTCVNIAAVEGKIVISPAMVGTIRLLNPNADIRYFSELGLDELLDAEKWCYNNLFEYMRRDVIGWMYYERQTDWARDYVVQMKIPTMWVAGSASEYYDEDALLFAASVLQKYPANIPMLGFGYAHDPTVGGNVGIGEYEGVKLHGEYGKYTAVFDTVGNLSFHTAINVAPENKKFTPAEKPSIAYDANKKYVAVTMMESGDSPAYIQYGLKQRQWDHASRGEVPYNISYGLNNYDLYPLLTEYWFETAKTYDYFFGAISGLGYSYPLIGFGDKGVVNEEGIYMDKAMIMEDHYTKANKLSQKLGFTCLGVYSFPEGTWNESHYEEFDEYVLQYMPDIDTVMADMHRGVYQLTKDQLMHTSEYGQRIYHCSTKWSLASFSNQQEAQNYLYDEILRTTSNGGQFFQCMAYSWHYGPDDIKAVIERFNTEHPGEYEFVTIDQLDEVYLKSINS